MPRRPAAASAWCSTETRSRSRPTLRPSSSWLALLVALGSGCDHGPPGSRLDGPRTWSADTTVEAWVTINDLPADTLSLTLMVEGAPRDVLSIGVRDQAGRMLVDAADPERSPNRVLTGRGTLMAMLPSATSSLPLSSSFGLRPVRLEWTGSPDSPVMVSAWIKRSTGTARATYELPLCLGVVGDDVTGDGPLSTALAAVARLWRQAGIEVVESMRFRISGAEAQPFARVAIDPSLGNDTPAVGNLLRFSARGVPGCLTLMLVPALGVADSDVAVWALAGGIPVPPVLGTARSGVVVSGALVAREPIFAGQVIAHEIGHALGLYHPTEGRQVGADMMGRPTVFEDPIDDTVACPPTADRHPADGALSASECQPFDSGNLMFWSPVRGAARLTAGQADIARRSALVR